MVKITPTNLLTIALSTLSHSALTLSPTHAQEQSSTTTTNNNNDNSEFFHTCSGGNYDKFLTLLTANPSLLHATTPDGEHCLHLCAISGNVDIVRTLLERGADPNIRSTFDQGLRMHPLSWNTYYGRYEILELLLTHGADIEADFDLGGSIINERTGELEKVTVLDVVEKILVNEMGEEERRRFVETRNLLMRFGAVRYAVVEPEL